MSTTVVAGSSSGPRREKKRKEAVTDSVLAPPPSKRKKTSEAGAIASAGPSALRKRPRKSSTDDASGTSALAPVPKAAKTSKVASPAAAVKKEKKKSEKRQARYIASPNIATSERISRAYQQRLYLIDKILEGDDRSSPSCCNFNVLGSTGNVYEVKLKLRPVCTCPDFPRSGLCKHILFVMLRVLKLDRNDPRVWQKALLASELRELLDISLACDGALASQSVRQRFQEIQGISGNAEEVNAGGKPKTVQREIEGDCPICYEGLDSKKGKAKEPVVYCRLCGNNVHRDCFEKWSRAQRSSGAEVSCIMCRAEWVDEPAKTKAKMAKNSSGYINLADVSAEHRNHSSLEDLYPDTHQWIGRRVSRRL